MGAAMMAKPAMQYGLPIAGGLLGGIGGKRGAEAANQPQYFDETRQTTPWDFDYAYGGGRPGTGGEQVLSDLLNSWVGLMGQQAQGQYRPWQYASPQGRELFRGGMQDFRSGRAS